MSISAHLWAVVAVVTGKLEDRKDERGITAIEYALMAAGIAVIVAAAMLLLKGKIEDLFNGINTTPSSTTT